MSFGGGEDATGMSQTPLPATGPPPAVCYRCGRPLKGVCRFCGRYFCHLHGGPGMLLCRRHWLITTAVGLGVTLLLIVGTLLVAATRSQP